MKRIKKFAALMLMVSFAMNVQAQFGGSGSGTASDPYLITNEDELFDVRNDLSAHYKLMADLDLTEWIAEESPKQGWAPIGNSTTPFMGVFDGNYHSIKGLTIKRAGEDEVGLFGRICQATIKNTTIINPNIIGGSCVGSIVGAALFTAQYYIQNNVCLGGSINGSDYVGGIIGRSFFGSLPYANTSCNIIGNYVSCYINASNYVGGIIGSEQSYDGSYTRSDGSTGYNDSSSNLISNIHDNFFNGIINALGTEVGGVVGELLYGVGRSYWANGYRITHNIVAGNVFGHNNTNGIAGEEVGFSYPSRTGINGSNGRKITNNVCCLDTIACGSYLPHRISGFDNTNNYASLSTVIVYNGEIIEVEDDDSNGVSYGARTLKRKTTYQGMGFDFDNQWAISELKSYPYNIKQSTPPELTSFTMGDASVVKGTANGSGRLYVFVGDEMYEGVVTDGQWQMSLGYVDASKRVTVSVQTGNLMPSPMLVVQKGDAAELPTGEVEGVYLPRNISTFCSNKSLDFSQTKGLTAYIAAGYNKGTVMLMRAKYVPAGEGVILMGDPGSYNVYTTSTKVYYSNMLKGVLEPTMIEPTDGDMTNFILTNGSTGIGFYAVSNTGELAAGKAYLQLPTDAFIQSGKAINFVFDDQTTGIFNVEASNENDSYYTLDGVRLSQRPTEKGIYIHKGKKIIITK